MLRFTSQFATYCCGIHVALKRPTTWKTSASLEEEREGELVVVKFYSRLWCIYNRVQWERRLDVFVLCDNYKPAKDHCKSLMMLKEQRRLKHVEV